ncbi:MAG: DUF4440 domain-containing protein [Bacteroidales bacterium]
MKRALFVALVLLSALSFACAKPGPLSDADKAAIQKVHDDYAHAWNAEKPDIPAMVKASYTEQSKVLVPNVPVVQGTDAIAKAYSSGPPARNFKFSAIEIDGRGDVAYAHGAYEGDWATPSGVMAHDKGKFVTVAKKQADGSWKILYDIWNSDAPPQALPVPTGTMAANASPEVKNLAWFVGTWRWDFEAKPSPLGPAGKLTLTVDCRWFADGQQLLCSNGGTTPAGPYHELFIMTADPETKAYKGYDVDNTGVAATFVATFKDNAWIVEHQNLKMGGKPLKLKTTFFNRAADSFSVKQEYSLGGLSGVNGEGACRKIGG